MNPVSNPYADINWNNIVQVKSVSHVHAIYQSKLDNVAAQGYEHIPISHYKPSVPMYPLVDFFDTVPEGVISSPNSEKARTGDGYHFNALGSFAEGNGVGDGEVSEPWSRIFKRIFDQLQYSDGGGITLNHPKEFDVDLRCAQLDYDDRVLGIEVFNNGTEINRGIADFSDFWDKILSTGRRCYGFAVIDWPDTEFLHDGVWYGSCMLLVPEKDEHECLKAYRNGHFYAIKKDTGLRFTSISYADDTMSCALNRSATIKFYTKDGVKKTVSGSSASCSCDKSDTFMRIEVTEQSDSDSFLWSNPIMFKTKQEVSVEKDSRILMTLS